MIATTTVLLKTENSPERLVRVELVPKLSPTLPYADTHSNMIEKTVNATFSRSMIFSASAAHMQKVPRKTYHKSKLSWLRMCCIMYEDVDWVSSGSELVAYFPRAVSSYVLVPRTLIAMGKTEMYIMVRRLNCTPGLTLAKLKVDVPVWRELAAWKVAASMREAIGRVFTSVLSRSITMIRSTSTKFKTNRMPKRIQVVLLGKRRV